MPRDHRLTFRDPMNVPDLLAKDRIVRRVRRYRAQLLGQRAAILAFNAAHPDDEPISTALGDGLIAWCDGGPWPTEALKQYYRDTRGVKWPGDTQETLDAP